VHLSVSKCERNAKEVSRVPAIGVGPYGGGADVQSGKPTAPVNFGGYSNGGNGTPNYAH
jgi:hypothetical protein